MAPTKKYAKQAKRRNGVYKKSNKMKSKSLLFKDAGKLDKPEKKWFDVASTLATPLGSAFVVTPANLSGIPAGDTGSSKIGSKVQYKSIHVRANALWGGGQTVNAPSQVRYVIVYDKQANGSLPARNDVFADGTLWNSDFNGNYKDRFIVLADVVSDQIQSNGQFCVSTEIFRSMDLEARGPNGGTIFSTGNICMFVAAASGWNDASSAHFPTIEFYSRIRYTDC